LDLDPEKSLSSQIPAEGRATIAIDLPLKEDPKFGEFGCASVSDIAISSSYIHITPLFDAIPAKYFHMMKIGRESIFAAYFHTD
jgi:hypothetical protein